MRYCPLRLPCKGTAGRTSWIISTTGSESCDRGVSERPLSFNTVTNIGATNGKASARHSAFRTANEMGEVSGLDFGDGPIRLNQGCARARTHSLEWNLQP